MIEPLPPLDRGEGGYDEPDEPLDAEDAREGGDVGDVGEICACPAQIGLDTESGLADNDRGLTSDPEPEIGRRGGTLTETETKTGEALEGDVTLTGDV